VEFCHFQNVNPPFGDLFVQLAYTMKHSTPAKNIKTKASCELANRNINTSVEETAYNSTTCTKTIHLLVYLTI